MSLAHSATLKSYDNTLTPDHKGNDNTLTPDHKRALQMILEAFTALASKKRKGRWGYDLGCGGGKTEATKAWCVANYELGWPYSVAISSSRVRDLGVIKRSLIEQGVPEQDIGLLHSYGSDPQYLEPTEDNDQRPVLLLTHAKIRGPKDIRAFSHYKNQPRSLVVYDESLLIARKHFLELVTVTDGVDKLKASMKYHDVDPRSVDQRALAYAQACLKILDDEWATQRSAPETRPETVRFPEPTDDIKGYYRRHGCPTVRQLENLIEYSELDLRVVQTNKGGGYCTFEIALPEHLNSLAVLDASTGLRILSTLNKTVRIDPEFDGKIKSYEAVTLRHLVRASGREAMEREFLTQEDQRKMSQEIFEVIRQIPDDEAICLWSFKGRQGVKRPRGGIAAVSIIDTLKQDLVRLGVDIEAMVTIDGVTRRRFLSETYGNETASNDKAYTQNAILVGSLFRSDTDIKSEIIGELKHHGADVSDWYAVRQSESAHVMYQAINRSACRKIKNGKALRTNVWLIHSDPNFEELLAPHMPGISWTDWEPMHLEALGGAKAKELARAIALVLDKVQKSKQHKVSSRALKGKVADEVRFDITNRTWRNALEIVGQKRLAGGWELVGRSFIYLDGFEDETTSVATLEARLSWRRPI